MGTNKQKAEQKRANQELAGIPDSRPFTAPESERPEGGVDRILRCHIGGIPVSMLNLDPQVLACLDYNATDEGVAEKNARPEVREPSGIQLGKDQFAKALDQRKDDVKEREIPLYESRDPLKEVADKYAKPGMKAKFLSANRVKDSGGTGDYEVVKNASGDPVKVRGMVLGHMPAERAQARNKHFRESGNRLLKQITETYKRDGGATAVSDQE